MPPRDLLPFGSGVREVFSTLVAFVLSLRLGSALAQGAKYR